MVKGLDVFRRHFSGYEDQYVLIGGTAATLAMDEAGLEFRATKDLDIVLHMEALTPVVCAAVWAFVEQGAYEIRQASETGKPVLYRFQKPASAEFPAMIELFCRAPEGIQIAPGTQLAPISFDEVVASQMQLLAPDAHLVVAPRIADDLDTFLTRLVADGTYNPRQIDLELPLVEVVDRLRRAYRRS